MDNGWEILSPEEEARYQRMQQTNWNIIRFLFFPLWVFVWVIVFLRAI